MFFYRQKIYLLYFAVLLTAVFLLPAVGLTASKVLAPDIVINKQYSQAYIYYQNLLATNRGHSRANWLIAARNFKNIYQINPDHALVPSALLILGRIYYAMYELSGNPLDRSEAIVYYEDLLARFPDHLLADDALYAIALIYLGNQQDRKQASRILARLVTLYPDGDMRQKAANQLRRLKGGVQAGVLPVAEIRQIRYWSNNNYTRVVIETSVPVKFKKSVLDHSGDQPRRLYVDLFSSRLAADEPVNLPIADGLLRQVRSAQFAPDTVRVVLDTQTDITEHNIFNLENPFRIVIDVMGSRRAGVVAFDHNIPPPTLAQQLGLGIRKIVLDPGHGGRDPGAVGPRGLKEKDIVLKVAKMLAVRLRAQLNVEVVLTRDRDIFIPLEERVAIANSRDADLFISIHANDAFTTEAKGIETYVLGLATDKHAMRLAALENATSVHQISDLQDILKDLLHNVNRNESVKLAEQVQNAMVTRLSQRYGQVIDRGVKKAPFVVLVGARMPAILTEIGFINNPVEAKRLQSDKFLNSVAEYIAEGVSQYVNILNLGNLGKLPFCPNSLLREKFYPWNINYMPAVKFVSRLDFEQKF